MTCEKSEQNEMLLQKINQQKTKLNQIICELSLWKVLIDQKKKKILITQNYMLKGGYQWVKPH